MTARRDSLALHIPYIAPQNWDQVAENMRVIQRWADDLPFADASTTAINTYPLSTNIAASSASFIVATTTIEVDSPNTQAFIAFVAGWFTNGVANQLLLNASVNGTVLVGPQYVELNSTDPVHETGTAVMPFLFVDPSVYTIQLIANATIVGPNPYTIYPDETNLSVFTI